MRILSIPPTPTQLLNETFPIPRTFPRLTYFFNRSSTQLDRFENSMPTFLTSLQTTRTWGQFLWIDQMPNKTDQIHRFHPKKSASSAGKQVDLHTKAQHKRSTSSSSQLFMIIQCPSTSLVGLIGDYPLYKCDPNIHSLSPLQVSLMSMISENFYHRTRFLFRWTSSTYHHFLSLNGIIFFLFIKKNT